MSANTIQHPRGIAYVDGDYCPIAEAKISVLDWGFLRSDAERFGALVLTDSSRGVLRGETPFRFREDAKSPVRVAKKTITAASIADEDRDLWEALRTCRQLLATEHDVPPYVIFHDKTLQQMLALRPQNESDLLGISGIGQVKLDRYGERFLSLLRN